jgi:hypothetical protein
MAGPRRMMHPDGVAPTHFTGSSRNHYAIHCIPGCWLVFVHLKKMDQEERLMTDNRWELPIVLIASATAFLSVWHFVALLLS